MHVTLDPDPAQEARARAIEHETRLLTRREHSQGELRVKLKQKGHAEADTIAAIEGLEKAGLHRDQRFTEAYVSYRFRGLNGPLKIRAELQRKGISRALLNQYLGQSEDEWIEQAVQFIERKKLVGLLDDISGRHKVYRRLEGRGFSHHQAMQAIGQSK